MLIRFTTPCVLGTTEYASGAEADLAPDMANAALSLGRGVRVMPDATVAPTPAPEPQPEPAPHADDSAPDDAATRIKRR
jgi:hypothetical protein